MGSRMAANLLKAGHTVTVWNRSPEAAEALVASGARRASSPKAHSRRVSLRNDKKAWLVGRRDSERSEQCGDKALVPAPPWHVHPSHQVNCQSSWLARLEGGRAWMHLYHQFSHVSAF